MKAQLAYEIAEGIQLLQLDNNDNYTSQELANITGKSISTIKRNKREIEVLDTALRLLRGDQL